MAGKLSAKAIKLADLVSYQEGSVVSRAIINNEAGTVTVFAFDEGQSLSEHTAPFDAIVYVLEGDVEITVSGDKIEAEAGDMVLMPANEPHALKATSKFKMLLIMVKG